MFFHPDDHRQRAAIGHIGLTAGAPVEVVGTLRPVDRRVALITLADTAPAIALTAAVVVGNDVVLAIGGIAAGADPGDVRLHRARRAAAGRTAAATTEKTVDGAVPPVVAAVRITLFINAARGEGAIAVDRQQGERPGADQQRAQPAEKATPRGTARGLPGQFLGELIQPVLRHEHVLLQLWAA